MILCESESKCLLNASFWIVSSEKSGLRKVGSQDTANSVAGASSEDIEVWFRVLGCFNSFTIEKYIIFCYSSIHL